MILPANALFTSERLCDLAEPGDVPALRGGGFTSLMTEPPGRMAMPACRVTNRTDYALCDPVHGGADGKFPAALDYPGMMITRLDDAFCLPHAPPFLPSRRQIVSDFLTPWAPDNLAWFQHVAGGTYRFPWAMDTGDTEHDIDTGFYLEHAVSAHYGHFIGDCLCRIYAGEVCDALFNDVKVIISGGDGADFQTYFLQAAGVPERSIVRMHGMVRCRHLLLATQSLGVERYASPTAAQLWSRIRDRCAARDVGLPDRLYLSRSGIGRRRLVNEHAVETIFERHGFAIIRPETLPVSVQVALVSNALLVAGTGGSGMFNLAFQGRLRSAFILRPDDFVQLLEMQMCAGHNVDLWYHLGHRSPAPGESWVVDIVRLESDVSDWLRSHDSVR
jgi:hypothetical protein